MQNVMQERQLRDSGELREQSNLERKDKWLPRIIQLIHRLLSAIIRLEVLVVPLVECLAQ